MFKMDNIGQEDGNIDLGHIWECTKNEMKAN